MKKDKMSRFFGNMGFMFRRSWELSGSIYFVTALHPLIILIILAVIGLNALIAGRLNKVGYEYQPLLTRFSRRYSYIYDMMLGIRGGQELRINGVRTIKRVFSK